MITATFDDKEFRKAIDYLARVHRQLPVRRMAVIAYRSVLRNFQASGRPKPWKPLKQVTIDKRRKAKQRRAASAGKKTSGAALSTKPLLDTGQHLRDTIGFKVFGTSNFKVYTRSPIAAVHQFGSPAGMIPKIPARPYMVWQTADKRAMVQLVLDAIARGL